MVARSLPLLLVLVACGSGAPSPVIAPSVAQPPPPAAELPSDKPRVYSRADLDALARQQAWLELVDHLEDIAPAERDDGWKVLAARAVVGSLEAPGDPIARAKRADDLRRRYPSLSASKEFVALEGDLGVRAMEQCAPRAELIDACRYLVPILESVGDSSKTLAAARAAVHGRQRAVAMTLYRMAADTEPVCADDEALALMMEGKTYPADSRFHDDAQQLMARCRKSKGKP